MLKNILKVGIVFGVGVGYVWSLVHSLNILAHQDMKQALSNSLGLIESGLLMLLIPIVVVAAVDVFIQWFNFRKRMRMSAEELKQEMKEMMGDPHVKGRIRSLQAQAARRRMMQAVPQADGGRCRAGLAGVRQQSVKPGPNALEFRPRPRPSQIPVAMAITFFTAPPTSTPTKSSFA